MHKGVVHDEGPIGMAEDPENGEIYLFYHPTDPVKVQNKLLPFKNGRLGSEEARYLGGQAVELTHEQVNDKLILTEGRVTIEHELDPVTDQEVSTGMVN